MSDDGASRRLLITISFICFVLYSFVRPFDVLQVVKKMVVNKGEVKVHEAAYIFKNVNLEANQKM